MKLAISDAVWQGYSGRLRAALTTDWVMSCPNAEALAREVADADALIGTALPDDARRSARRLKLFQYPGAGAQHVKAADLPTGCVLTNVYEHEAPIAEYVLAVILLQTTRLVRSWSAFRTGRWEGNGRTGGETHDELLGKTLGLVGYGRIGQAVAARARAFGMRLLAVRQAAGAPHPYGGPAPDFIGGPGDLVFVLGESDFLVIACPLSDSTRSMIGPAQLAKIRRGAMLINVSRAEIIEEQPLFDALREGRLAAAALDVWYQYPTSPDEVMHGSRLPFHELPNVIVTPHLSAWTDAMIARRIRRVAENLDRLASGRPMENVLLMGTWTPSGYSS